MKTIWKAGRLVFATILTMLVLTICASATDVKLGVGIVDTEVLNLRAEPSTDSDSNIISRAYYGDVVVILEQLDGWYKVNYNLDEGYMSADYLTFKVAENAELGDGMANDVVNLRSTPSTDSDVLCQLEEGELCTIIGINNGWYKVTYGDYVGYIRSDLLDLTEAPLTNTVTTITNDASGTAAAQSVSVADSIATQLIEYAKSLLGSPYVWGGTSPSGFDCSGFTQYVFKQFGYSLNRTAASQLNNGVSVSKTELQPGDLVFFSNTYYTSAAASHVGIYIGNNQFIHAASGGVKITDLSSEYYASRYCGARRIL